MALTWTETGSAFDGGFMVGQVVRYDQEPPWAAFIRGVRVGRGRVATREEAVELVERAWAGQRRRQAPDGDARADAEAEQHRRSEVMARSVVWPSRTPPTDGGPSKP